MTKFTLFLTLLCVVAYGACLSCNSCRSKEKCKEPESKTCPQSKKYCISIGKKTNSYYFKGCADKKDTCEEKGSNGKPKYPECEVCESDKCNNLKFN